MSRGTRAARDADYRKGRREDGERDALAGRPQAASDAGYVDAYERARRSRAAITDGYLRSDPLERIGALVRRTFGDAEAEAILRASLALVPEPGAPAGAYIAAVTKVIVDRQPAWAKAHGFA